MPPTTIHTDLSNDSSLSNDSLSGNSSSSLDHEARLSNARLTSSKYRSGGGAAAASSGGGRDTDRDMTEDEVAIMVQNALRKARRAMDNSSPMVSKSDDDDVDSNKGGDTDDDNMFTGGGGGYGMSSPTSQRNKYTSTSNTKLGAISTDSTSFSPTSKQYITDEVDFDLDTNSSSKSFNLGLSTSVESEDMDGGATRKAGSGGNTKKKTDLAKRIEKEIQSARAFAEKKYYSVEDGEYKKTKEEAVSSISIPPSSPLGRKNSNQSARSADTPLMSNTTNTEGVSDFPSPKSSPNRTTTNNISSSSPRDVARERMARSKDKIAAANEKLSKKTGTGSTTPRGAPATTPIGGISSNRPPKTPKSPTDGIGIPNNNPKSPTDPKTPGQSEFDALLAVSPNPVVRNNPKSPTNPKTPGQSELDAILAVSPNPVVRVPLTVMASSPSSSSKSLSANNDPPIENDSGLLNSPAIHAVLSPITPLANANNNKPPLSSIAHHPPPPPPNTNSNKPREHRQVLFRHPYPLPPPPPLPRSDDIIVSSHSAPEKNVNIRWSEPDDDLAALIEAAGEDHNLVRRSNACGAIKVLASKESNRPKLCRTMGLLDVVVKASWDDAVDSDALDARTRAVTTLLYLSEPKDNRLMLARHHQVLEVLVKVIEEDTGEARWRATSALATLAKTPGNRGYMGRLESLPTVLAELMLIGHERKDDKKTGLEGGDTMNIEEEGRANVAESREDDNSASLQEDSTTRGPSFDTMDDERMLTHTYTGTFTDGTGTTFTEDDMTYQSYGSNYDGANTYEEGEDMDEDGSQGGSAHSEGGEGSAGGISYPSEDEGSVQEEEGVEMQISSLKKLNIENASDFLAKSQMSACATLTHLSKHCANAPMLCKNEKVLDNLIFLAAIFDSPIHSRCLEMLCNFTRFPSNNTQLAHMPKAIETLLVCGKSKIAEDRMWSIRTIQNLCSDASSKVALATNAMLSLLSTAAMRKDYEEQYAAVGALMNLSTEPGSIVPLTNTKTVVATLVHLAHSPNTPSAVRKIACDSLATIGLWLQTLASAGTVPEEIPFSPLPTHSATGWLRWDN